MSEGGKLRLKSVQLWSNSSVRCSLESPTHKNVKIDRKLLNQVDSE
jgi:hypothetical protein